MALLKAENPGYLSHFQKEIRSLPGKFRQLKKKELRILRSGISPRKLPDGSAIDKLPAILL